jgi:hypothetical protein
MSDDDHGSSSSSDGDDAGPAASKKPPRKLLRVALGVGVCKACKQAVRAPCTRSRGALCLLVAVACTFAPRAHSLAGSLVWSALSDIIVMVSSGGWGAWRW